MTHSFKFVIIAPKLLGTWTNTGSCVANGPDPQCGPGNQTQLRTCTDGTVDKCTESDKLQIVTCEEAGTQLPHCIGNQKTSNLLLYLHQTIR